MRKGSLKRELARRERENGKHNWYALQAETHTDWKDEIVVLR